MVRRRNGRLRNRYKLEAITGLSDLEKRLSEGGPEFTVMPISFYVNKVKQMANGGRRKKNNGAISYSLIFPQEENWIGKAKVAYLQLRGSDVLHFAPLTNEERKNWNLESYCGAVGKWIYGYGAENRGDIFMGYAITPKTPEEPFIMESNSKNHYAIAGGLSNSKPQLDELLENEGFYNSRAKELRKKLVSKVIDDKILLANIRGINIAEDVIKIALNKQYKVPTADVDNKPANADERAFSQYLKNFHAHILSSITRDYHKVDRDVKPNLKWLMPQRTYKNRIKQHLATLITPSQYLTPTK